MSTDGTTTPQVLIEADAKNRAWRTFLQGLGVDVVVAIAAAVLLWLPDADVSSGEAWGAIGLVLAKTLIQTVAAYVMRLKVTPIVTLAGPRSKPLTDPH